MAVGLPSSLDIAQAAELRPIADIAAELGLRNDEFDLYGRYKAKVSLEVLDRLSARADAKVVAVTAITPTAHGEGKTTTAVALTQGLAHLGTKPVLALREPSLGPVFGIKGGAAGGGWSQVVPMEELNLHFTGDLHAVSAANNLLAAMIDAHVLSGNERGIDPLRITWRRCLDMNDRSLRHVVTGLGGHVNGIPRETGFDITAASEVMAIMAIARDLRDLRHRLGAISIDGRVTAEDIGAAGAMAVLLEEALKPNLVQTLEGQPAFVHCGPFANIASGNNSVVASLVAAKLGDYVVTEAGFGSDMGFEKFCDIVCRIGGFEPAAVVLVATGRTHAEHGLRTSRDTSRSCARSGTSTSSRSTSSPTTTPTFSRRSCATPRGSASTPRALRRLRTRRQGAVDLAAAVVAAAEAPGSLRFAYELEQPIEEKIAAIATRVYGAADVHLEPAARKSIKRLAERGVGDLPIVMKTHLSLGHDRALGSTPAEFRFVRLAIVGYTGAGWLVALCGDMQTMPGLGLRACRRQRRRRRRRPHLSACSESNRRASPALRRELRRGARGLKPSRAGFRPMELAGLESATSWVRYRPNEVT